MYDCETPVKKVRLNDGSASPGSLTPLEKEPRKRSFSCSSLSQPKESEDAAVAVTVAGPDQKLVRPIYDPQTRSIAPLALLQGLPLNLHVEVHKSAERTLWGRLASSFGEARDEEDVAVRKEAIFQPEQVTAAIDAAVAWTPTSTNLPRQTGTLKLIQMLQLHILTPAPRNKGASAWNDTHSKYENKNGKGPYSHSLRHLSERTPGTRDQRIRSYHSKDTVYRCVFTVHCFAVSTALSGSRRLLRLDSIIAARQRPIIIVPTASYLGGSLSGPATGTSDGSLINSENVFRFLEEGTLDVNHDMKSSTGAEIATVSPLSGENSNNGRSKDNRGILAWSYHSYGVSMRLLNGFFNGYACYFVDNKRLVTHFIEGRAVKFWIVSAARVARFEPAEWRAVVAVFLTNKPWQLDKWPFPTPERVFAHIKGFHVAWIGEPVAPVIERWGVQILRFSPMHRHNDPAVCNEFWQCLDRFLMA